MSRDTCQECLGTSVRRPFHVRDPHPVRNGVKPAPTWPASWRGARTGTNLTPMGHRPSRPEPSEGWRALRTRALVGEVGRPRAVGDRALTCCNQQAAPFAGGPRSYACKSRSRPTLLTSDAPVPAAQACRQRPIRRRHRVEQSVRAHWGAWRALNRSAFPLPEAGQGAALDLVPVGGGLPRSSTHQAADLSCVLSRGRCARPDAG
jgi:hypothetical protein